MSLFKLGEIISENQARNINGVTLAFVGDAVYSLYVREKLAVTTDFKSGELNKRSSEIVNASAQARFSEKLAEIFTETETEVFRRARNAKKGTRAKNSSVCDYNKSTGFEAVLGYLYLTGNYERLNYLLNFGGEENENGR